MTSRVVASSAINSARASSCEQMSHSAPFQGRLRMHISIVTDTQRVSSDPQEIPISAIESSGGKAQAADEFFSQEESAA